jgi:cytochrome c1
MPYAVGEQGSYGCSGYPVVKEGGEVMGCHKTADDAKAQVQALYAAEADKADGPNSVNPSSTPNPTYPNVGVKTPSGMKTAPQQKGKMKIRKPKRKAGGGDGADASGAFSS